ncbi:MAG: NAD(P)/FAD-dependent oxidoreductase [Proteobacteria bacterium]|nr:NAD(P)/FAD-dependent oxidoreductase [Pseudomonadota bacterium]
MKIFDVIIIGAGAAGLMCAIESGKRGRKTLVIESSKDVAQKIRISGGGRCNFTNLNITPDNFLSQNSHFAISALKRFSQNHFIKLVEKHNISYHEKTLGQLFCDISSKEIIKMLLDECKENNVEILTETKVLDVKKDSDEFVLSAENQDFKATSLVIATGGLSIPKMGASDFGYKIAKNFGLKIINPTPALVPLTLSEKDLEKTKELSGVSAKVSVKVGSRAFKESLLFTHKGLSGPAILQISSYLQQGQKLSINFAPEIDIFTLLKNEKTTKPKQEIKSVLTNILPKSLVSYFLEKNNINGFLADLSDKNLKIIAQEINNFEIIPNGTEGFAKAEVTLGGVDCNEISSKTFETNKVKNLYFIGEVLDVTGHLGGYNFQWAWSSGFCAGQFT